jgi:myo-inositol 2-dehydrogenase/D-chiro-inositol 1-dehydrogenase
MSFTLPESSRREFLKTGTSAAGVGALAAAFPGAAGAYAGGSGILKVGLVGCGGRGTSAAENALKADPEAKLVAMADAFQDKLEFSLRTLKRSKEIADRVDVPPEQQFVGLDAYKKLIDVVDVVLLCTPPGFRPPQFQYAVEAGKHVFIEKPMATDAVGVRSIRDTVSLSKTKPISVVAGFCWRYDVQKKELFQRILDGQIGEVVAVYGCYLTNPVRPMPAAHERKPEQTDLEWQMRNWYNFTWLSGDGLVEQACHTVDWVSWAKSDIPPASCIATGGRQIPAEGGNIYDHMAVNWVWDDGTRGFLAQRQISGCHNETALFVLGTKGQATTRNSGVITGAKPWAWEGEKPGSMYDLEHVHFFKSIRAGANSNDGDRMANSTLMAIMGRTAAYTGQEVAWDDVFNSQEKLVPDITDGFNTPVEFPPYAMPGKTKVI